jgi:hypothetical protein
VVMGSPPMHFDFFDLLDTLNSSPPLTIHLSFILSDPFLPSSTPTPQTSPPPPPPTHTPPHQSATLSNFLDFDSFKNKFKNSNQNILFSLNVQSLQSKIGHLSEVILDLKINECNPCIIALQETWFIPYTDKINIPNYNFIHTHRKVNRGGGVGFFIRDDLDFKKLDNFSKFIPNTFECLTIEVQIGGKKNIVSTIYRSPTPPAHTSASDHQKNFISFLETHLSSLSHLNTDSFILLDSNINLLPPPPQTSHSNTLTQFIQMASHSAFTKHLEYKTPPYP